jgi:predicted MPP superfamily phosphohydrolase
MLITGYRCRHLVFYKITALKNSGQSQNYFLNLKIKNMKTRLFFYMVMLIFISSSCTKESRWDSYDTGKGGHHGHNYGLKIAVVSDIHYTDASLLANNAAAGTAFQNYVARDPKLLEYSEPIFKNIMWQLRSQDPDILLIPGDLTKDGEKIDHQKMAGLLKQLSDAHIKVYVVPGNHDINNPEAMRYNGNNAYPTLCVCGRIQFNICPVRI